MAMFLVVLDSFVSIPESSNKYIIQWILYSVYISAK